MHAPQVGRARARLKLGDLQGVIADAHAVSVGFECLAAYDASPARRQNSAVARLLNRSASVPVEYRELEVDGVTDPRAPTYATGAVTTDGATPHSNQHAYPNRGSDTPAATRCEAQLMTAEAEGGRTAVDMINMLRGAYNLPHSLSTDPAEIEAQVREERRLELWIQGTGMADMLRWNEPFPAGADHHDRACGTGTCAPLPDPGRCCGPIIN